MIVSPKVKNLCCPFEYMRFFTLLNAPRTFIAATSLKNKFFLSKSPQTVYWTLVQYGRIRVGDDGAQLQVFSCLFWMFQVSGFRFQYPESSDTRRLKPDYLFLTTDHCLLISDSAVQMSEGRTWSSEDTEPCSFKVFSHR